MKKISLLGFISALAISLILFFFWYQPDSEAVDQDPKPPFPYVSENVSFASATDTTVKLHGTLTIPSRSGNFPAVVLITGSGPQNRDEEIDGHKPFLVISDYLTKRGIAVLRYDDRYFDQPSNKFWELTSDDHVADVSGAISYLQTRPEIRNDQIGLIGHSGGGIDASITASKSQSVAFVILLASPGMKGLELIPLQNELINRASGISEEDIRKSKIITKEICDLTSTIPNRDTLRSKLIEHAKECLRRGLTSLPPGKSFKETFMPNINIMSSSWWIEFINQDPAEYLENMTCPVLVLIGEKDLQVPPKENLPLIEKALLRGGNKHFVVKELPNLNHFFLECETCTYEESPDIDQSFSPIALKEMDNWIKSQIK